MVVGKEKTLSRINKSDGVHDTSQGEIPKFVAVGLEAAILNE